MAKAKKGQETDGLEISISSPGSDTRTVIIGDPEKIKRHLDRRADLRREVIKKASIVDGRRLDVSFTEQTASGTDKHSKKCSAPVHPDLKEAFARLNIHLGRLCFQPLSEKNPLYEGDDKQPEFICPVHCLGFSITGNEDTEAVTLHGYRTLPNAKDITLESPSQKWDGDIYDYDETDDLSEAVMTCIGEVELYLFPSDEWPNCKTEPDNQLSLFPDEENGELTEQERMDKEMPLTDEMAAKYNS